LHPRRLIAHYRMSRLPLAPLLFLLACNGARSKAESTATRANEDAGDAAARADVGSDAGTEAALPSLRVATYNVNFGMAGDAATIALIRELDADLLFVQETNPKWVRALRRELGDEFPHMRFRKHSWPAGGLGVLSRHPLAEEQLIREQAGHFPAMRVVVESPIGAVQALNVHLDPPGLRARQDGWIRAYYRSQEVHLKEITAFAKRLDPDIPTLIAGDFNEDLRGKAVVWLLERGFALSIAEFVPTWRWQTERGTVKWQLDHLLFGPRLRVIDAGVVAGGNSDHQPIVATVAAATAP